MPAAAIVIPHYNDVTRLSRCLSALEPQISDQVDVIVVDNASSDPLDGVRAAWPWLRIVVETRRGAAEARNRGVVETAAPRLFFLDCDCVPGPDWLSTAFEVAPTADLVGGHVAVFDETPPPRSGAEAFETVFAFDNRRYVERAGFSVTANLLTTRVVWDTIGGFRGGVSEDTEWCRRATSAGFTLSYADGLRVAHPTRSDWPALERKFRRITRESWGLRDQSLRARLVWGARGVAMLGSILAHAPRILASDRLSGTGERYRALTTPARQRIYRCGWMLRQAIGAEI